CDVHLQGHGLSCDRLPFVYGVPAASDICALSLHDALPISIDVVDADGVAVGENHVDLAHAGGGAGQELGQHQVGPCGDGEVRTQIEAPAQLVLQIAGRVVLFGVEAAPARDVIGQADSCTAVAVGLHVEAAPASGGG